jgi:hypothetical protein
MKKLNVFSLLGIIIFGLAGCHNDDDISIIGTWQQESIELFIHYGIVGIPETSYEIGGENSIVTFRSEGTGSFSNSEGEINFIWNLKDKVLTISNEYESIPGYMLNLTTLTHKLIVGEQTITKEELLTLIEFINPELIDEQVQFLLTMFPNLSARLTISLKRI